VVAQPPDGLAPQRILEKQSQFSPPIAITIRADGRRIRRPEPGIHPPALARVDAAR